MLARQRLSSVQLMIMLFLCGTPVVILQSFYAETKVSFLHTVIAAVVSAAILLLSLLPAAIIRRKTDCDFITFAQRTTPNAVMVITAVYCLYFVYAAVYFLGAYIEMMMGKINPNSNAYVLAFLLIAACVYGAYKGINAITRCAIFLFAFAVLAYFLIFCGNIANLDFSGNFYETESISDFFRETASLSALALLGVIYACTSGKTKNFRYKQPLFLVLALLALVLISEFFVYFVLGSYGRAQDFQFFTLSKTSKIGIMQGLDSVYLALSTSAVFALISMLLVCMNRSAERQSNLTMSVIFGTVVFALYVCSAANGFCREILSNPYIFLAFTAVCVAVESVYFFIFRRRYNAKKAFVHNISDDNNA